MHDEPQLTADATLHRLLTNAMGPRPLNDEEIESLLNSAEQTIPLSDEQSQRIVGKVHRLLSAATKTPAGNADLMHPAAQRPRLVSATTNELPRPIRVPAVAALMASMLALVLVIVLTPETPSSNSGLSELPDHSGFPGRSVQRYWMTAKPLPDAVPVAKVAVGDEIVTGELERRRVTLPDGSVLFVNSESQVKISSERRVEVMHGEVFVEVVPAFDNVPRHFVAGNLAVENRGTLPFEVVTPNRTVTALGTKFSVSVDDSETDVMVTQGKVKISGVDAHLTAGQQVSASGGSTFTSASPVSARLEWTRDLMAAATGPLVPKSEYSGGALVTVDPDGQSAKLSLRNYHIDVHIEDGFARTTIDQTYFNHTHSRLEGTFHFPLPADASLSRLAMYVNGKLMEGGMAERDHARNTFEEIKRKMLDPALLEWVDGSTFKMRVFPLEPRQEKRIVLSYSQRLNSAEGQLQYRFPAGHTMDAVRDWSAHVRVKGGAGSEWHSQSHAMTATEDAGDLLLDAGLKQALLDRDLVLRITEASGRASALRVNERDSREEEKALGGLTPSRSPSEISNFKSEGQQYLMLRLRHDLPGEMQRQPHHWVFLFEHAGDRSPLLARAQIEIIRTLLENAEHSDSFSIVTASSRATLYSDEPQLCSVDNIATALKYLENVHLVGALDLAAAFKASGRASALRGSGDGASNGDENTHGGLTPSRSPVLIHVGSGMPALGERDASKLAAMIPAEMQYVGIGVGRRWNQAMMKQAASRTGGLSTQINPDEEIAWRAFDVFSKLHSPRLMNLAVRSEERGASGENLKSQISDLKSEVDIQFLLFSDTITQGEELAAICRVPEGKPLPTSVTVTATLNGQPWTQTIPVANVNDQATYLPRHWAKLEIDRLLADNAEQHRDAIVALSKTMYVMSPFTSLLVLENEEMYTQFNIDRGRKDHWALYPCPEQIDVVVENGGESAVAADSVATSDAKTPADVMSTVVRLPVASYVPSNSITLKRITPTSAVQMLRNLYSGLGTSAPVFEADVAANRIIVSGNADQILQSQQLLMQIDGENNVENRRDVRYVPLMHGTIDWARSLVGNGHMRFSGTVQYPYYTLRGTNDFGLGSENRSLNFWGRAQQQSNMWFDDTAVRFRFDADNDGDGIREGIWNEALNVPVEDFGLNASGNRVWSFRKSSGSDATGMDFDFNIHDLYSMGDSPGFEREGLLSHTLTLPGYNFPTAGRFLFGGQNAASAPPGWAQQELNWEDGARALSFHDPAINLRGEANVQQLADPGILVLKGNAADVVKLQGLVEELEQDSLADMPLPHLMFGSEASSGGRPYLKLSGASERQRFGWFIPESGPETEARFSSGSTEFGEGDGEPHDRLLVENRFLGRRRFLSPEQNKVRFSHQKALRSHRWSADNIEANTELVALPTFQVQSTHATGVNAILFGDLISHAPGLNTSRADVMAVLEKESGERKAESGGGEPAISNFKFEISNAMPGRVDAAARALIEKSRSLGWESITLPGRDGEAGVTVHYDGQGHHVWERIVSEGLREHVVCDGSTLWHVYREIGLASKRPFSRFHHREFTAIVPWLLPSADELARGADVITVDEHTVAIVPISPASGGRQPSGTITVDSTKPKADDQQTEMTDLKSEISNLKDSEQLPAANAVPLTLHLVFKPDGRLEERRIVERASGRILHRVTYDADGTVRIVDAEGKELAVLNLHRSTAAAPQLVPDLNGLVVLPMPVRTPEVVMAKENAAKETADLGQVGVLDEDLSEDDAVSLMLSCMANGNGARMVEIARKRFIDKGDTRDGIYVLLSRFPQAVVQAAVPRNPAAENAESQSTPGLTPPGSPGFDLRPSVEGSPLKQFVRQYINSLRDGDDAHEFRTDASAGSFLQRMATARNLYFRWLTETATKDLTQAQVQQEVDRTLEFIASCRTLDMGWGLMSVMRPRLSTPKLLAAYSKAAARFEQHPQIGLLVRRERMTALFAAGKHEEGRILFKEWLLAHLTKGFVPPIGTELYNACISNNGQKQIDELLLETAKQLVDAHMLMTLHSMSVQMRELGNTSVADQMMTLLLTSLDAKERPDVSLYAIEQLRHLKDPRADKLLDQVMELPTADQIPGLWRFASKLAEDSGRKRLAAERLERAIQLEFATRPTVINIQTVRSDYTQLLAKYDELITASTTLELAPPADLGARIVQAADQWRTLDEDDTAACQTASRLLAKLNSTELAWDYLTTPLAENSGESAPWIALARNLVTDAQTDLASMAWTQAFELESTNPEILLEHALMLQAAGRRDPAKALLKQAVAGTWQPRFAGAVQQCRDLLRSF